MKYLVILLISVIYLVNADNGHFIPKSVYFIDENGNPSIPLPINPGFLHRVRRQGPGFGQPFGGFAFPQLNFPQIQPGQPGQTSFTQTSQTLSSRFGEDEPVVTGQTQTFHSSGGKFQQTSTVLRPDGSVQTNKQTGKTKRDTTSQLQSQGSEDGKNQLQSQSMGAPGGFQTQSQNQPGLSQTQSQGSSPVNQQPISDDRAQMAGRLPGREQQNQHQQPNHPQQQPHYPQGQQNYPQGQPNYPQGQQNYPQGQPGFAQFPFGFGGFGSPFGGFPQQGFGFPQQPGFGFAPGFQPGFQPFPGAGPQQGVQQTGFVSTLDNRFGEDEVPTVVGGTQTITSQNGVFHATSSVLKPDGQVETTHTHGKFPKKKN